MPGVERYSATCYCGATLSKCWYVMPVAVDDDRLTDDERYIDGDPLRPNPAPVLRGRVWANTPADVERHCLGRQPAHDIYSIATGRLTAPGACRSEPHDQNI